MSLVLALDIGTSGGRALIADSDGRRIGSASRPWRYRTDADGFPELDAGTVYASLASAAREAVRSSVARPEAIAAVGVTSQRYSVVLVDSKDAVLYSGPNTDPRGIQHGIAMERTHGAEIYRTSGRLPAFLYLPARLAWFRENRPEVTARTTHAFSLADWIVYRLTGEAGTHPSQAAEMLVYDLTSGAWSPELMQMLEVPPRYLPPITTEPIGTLTEEVARDFGLHPGTPVVSSGCDTQCALLGLGVTEAGDVGVSAGTTMLVDQVADGPLIDTQRRLWTSPHTIPGRFVLEAHSGGDAGGLIDWLLGLFGFAGNYGWLETAATSAQPGSGGVVLIDPAPTPMGDYPMLRVGGFTFPIPVMMLGRPREDFVRATLESIAYAIRAALEWVEETSGVPAGDIGLGGGVARSLTFARIVASVLGREIRRAREPQTSALGACIVAAASVGLHSSVGVAAAKMSDAGDVVKPDPTWLAIYDGLYQSWTSQRARYEETRMRVSDLEEW